MKTTFFLKWKIVAVATLILIIATSCSKDNDPKNTDGIDTTDIEGISWNGTYQFTTTNFDDGWTSTVKEDWVEVTKGSMKVLLHYPKEGTIFPADPEPLINAAWNILVAPRYSNIKNYIIAETITDWNRAYCASATLTEQSTGNEVYVAFFRKGDTGWMEFVSPNKQTFTDYFGIDINTITWDSDLDTYDPLVVMTGYNKFAVAANDLPGKWSNNFASNTFYVNIYTGIDAGMSTYTSTETFEFGSSIYNWDLVAANSSGGHTDFAQAESSGIYSLPNNWQVYFSNIEDDPKTYNAFFSCIKGARILWLQDAEYPTSYTSYGRIE